MSLTTSANNRVGTSKNSIMNTYDYDEYNPYGENITYTAVRLYDGWYVMKDENQKAVKIETLTIKDIFPFIVE